MEDSRIQEQIEDEITTELSNLYFNQYYQNYIDQMESLDDAEGFERDDRFFGHFDDQHIQYKIKLGDKGETFPKKGSSQ